MLFITNRFPRQSIRTRPGRKFNFDLDNNAAGNSVYFCDRTGYEQYVEIGSIEFFSRLKRSPYRQILIYIHGFSNLPEGVFTAAEKFQNLCDGERAEEVLVVPIVWPCDNDLGVVKDYWDDQKSADESAFSFTRVLDKFLAWRNSEDYNPQSDPCLKRINVLAHSMGNRVLRETLANWKYYDFDLPPEKESSFMLDWKLRKGALDGQKVLHARADYQQAS